MIFNVIPLTSSETFNYAFTMVFQFLPFLFVMKAIVRSVTRS